jgi:hypothetical protein
MSQSWQVLNYRIRWIRMTQSVPRTGHYTESYTLPLHVGALLQQCKYTNLRENVLRILINSSPVPSALRATLSPYLKL